MSKPHGRRLNYGLKSKPHGEDVSTEGMMSTPPCQRRPVPNGGRGRHTGDTQHSPGAWWTHGNTHIQLLQKDLIEIRPLIHRPCKVGINICCWTHYINS